VESVDAVLEYWFGTNPDDVAVIAERTKLWWSKPNEVDADIRHRFEGLLLDAAHGALDLWQMTCRGQLALIILTDQFPRNIYRGTAQTFAYDARALAWCLGGLELGFDRQLRPIERAFFYLPLEHSESLPLQDRSVALFTELARSVPESWKEPFTSYLDFAARHREIIARFGRFPHRNILLGRASTDAELAFLQQPGSSF
jgi:uncharacterized protein (DUF924 family)